MGHEISPEALRALLEWFDDKVFAMVRPSLIVPGSRASRRRGVAQRLEPELWGFRVVGSNPTTPTNPCRERGERGERREKGIRLRPGP